MNKYDEGGEVMGKLGDELAFPRIETITRPDCENDSSVISSNGLTKREIAAMFAMSGLLANPYVKAECGLIEVAKRSVCVADFILEELEKKGGRER